MRKSSVIAPGVLSLWGLLTVNAANVVHVTVSDLVMSGAKVGIGLGARGLKDKVSYPTLPCHTILHQDWGPGVSDPYVVISRPSSSGGFQKLRTSEVKNVGLMKSTAKIEFAQNSLNPDWNDFLFTESELNGGDENLKLK